MSWRNVSPVSCANRSIHGAWFASSTARWPAEVPDDSHVNPHSDTRHAGTDSSASLIGPRPRFLMYQYSGASPPWFTVTFWSGMAGAYQMYWLNERAPSRAASRYRLSFVSS